MHLSEVRLTAEGPLGKHSVEVGINSEDNYLQIDTVAHERTDGNVPSPVELRRRFPDAPNLWSNCIRLREAEMQLDCLCGGATVPAE